MTKFYYLPINTKWSRSESLFYIIMLSLLILFLSIFLIFTLIWKDIINVIWLVISIPLLTILLYKIIYRHIYSKNTTLEIDNNYLVLPYNYHAYYPKKIIIKKIPLGSLSIGSVNRNNLLIFIKKKFWKNIILSKYIYYSRDLISDDNSIFYEFNINKDKYYLFIMGNGFINKKEFNRFKNNIK